MASIDRARRRPRPLSFAAEQVSGRELTFEVELDIVTWAKFRSGQRFSVEKELDVLHAGRACNRRFGKPRQLECTCEDTE